MVQSTIDKIKDTTIIRMIRKMAGVIDEQNTTVENVQQQLDNFDLDGVKSDVSTLKADVADINTKQATDETQIVTNKTNIQSLRDANIIITKDITAIKEKDTEQDKSISALDTEIDTVNTTLDNKITTVNDKVPKSYMLYRNGEGKIQLQAESNDGTLTDSNILDMIIPYQYDILSGTTNRSFRLKVSMSNGTTYVTNDFVIPEGGGTDVTVTGITLSKDTSDVNRIHVTINLSDSTTIDSGFISLVDNVSASVADNKLTISVNGVSSVPVAIDVTGQITAGNGITVTDGVIAIDTTVVALKSNLDTLSNKVTENTSAIDALESKYDSMSTQITELSTGVSNAITQAQDAYNSASISDNHLVLTKGNGNSDEIVLPSGDDWEEVDLNNWPTDWVANTEVEIDFNIEGSASASSWTSTISKASISAGTSHKIVRIVLTDALTTPGILIYFTNTGDYVLPICISSIQSYIRWNTTNEVIITINYRAFNYAGAYAGSEPLKTTEIIPYVHSIKRRVLS